MRRILLSGFLSLSAAVVWVHAFAEETPPAPIAVEEPAAEAPAAVPLEAIQDVAAEAPKTTEETPPAAPTATVEPAPTPAPAAEAPVVTETSPTVATSEESIIPEPPALPEDAPPVTTEPAPEPAATPTVEPAPKEEPAPAPQPAEPKAEAPAAATPSTTPEAPAEAPASVPAATASAVSTATEAAIVATPAANCPNSIRVPDLSGEWCGSWNSCTNGHSGPMRATFCRLCNGDYQVTFCGRFCKVIPFRYSTVLKTTGYSDGVVYLSGSQSLGPIFGTFSYNAWANDRTFASGYAASKDQGEFHLSR